MLDYNSSENQTIKSNFVDTHVLVSMGGFINEILSNCDSEWHDDVLSIASAPDYAATLANANFEVTEIDGEYYHHESDAELNDEFLETELAFDTVLEAQEDCVDFNGLDLEHSEALDFWAVSEHLAGELESHGESVAEIHGVNIWGRTCSGQHISLDHCISVVCEELGLLEGE